MPQFFLNSRILFVALISLIVQAPSALYAAGGERYALLVGVREYDRNELRNLPYSEADVVSLAQVLKDAGYRPENIVTMTQTLGARQGRQLPLAANIRKELNLLLENRTEEDSILIVLAGHGVQFHGADESYFCPSDARLDEVATLLPFTEIYSALEHSKAGFKLLLVDACRNDPQSNNSRSRPTVKLESVTRPQKIDPPGGVAAFFSCSSGERAFEDPGLKHGVFFHFVIQGLNGEADLDHDRIVTLPELQQFAMKRVPDFVRSAFGVVQTPDMRGQTRGLVPLIKLDYAKTLQLKKTPLRISGQSVSGRQIVQKVIELLEQRHYSKQPLDDDRARRWLDAVLDDFDGSKSYFLQSDIDRFHASTNEIDNQARLGDVGFAWDIFHVWVERRTQVLSWIDDFVDTPQDFAVDEEFVLAPRARAWPRDESAAREDWRKRVKYEILNRRVNGDDEAEAILKTSRHLHYMLLNQTQFLDDAGILEGCLSALGHTYDRNTTYLSARSTEEFVINIRMRLVGIGAQLQMRDGDVALVKTIPGGPAARDGRLKKDDRIVGVGPDAGDIRDIDGMKLNDVVALIRGVEGTPVKLKVLSKGADAPAVYELKRGNVELIGARSKVFSESRRDETLPVKIGYISLPSLYSGWHDAVKKDDAAPRSSTRDVRKLLQDFNRESVDVVVLDLRNNSGGALSEATEMPGLFLPSGTVLQVQERNGAIKSYQPKQTPVAWDRPLIVMTSRLTGPGPEIIAGVLQDYRRGLVLGDSATSGFAMVHTVADIGAALVSGNNPPKLGSVKYATERFFLPSGRTPDRVGLKPDLELLSFSDFEDPRPASPPDVADTVPAAAFLPSACVSRKMIDNLRTIAATRQQVTPEFQEFSQRVQTYRKRRERVSVPLNDKKYFEEFSETIKSNLVPESDAEVITRDAYLNEVLAIALDFAPRREWRQAYDAGVRSLRQEAYADAVKSFSAAIAAEPDRPEAHVSRALAHAGLGDWQNAVADAAAAGVNAIPSVAGAAVELKAGDKTSAKIAKGDRLVVEKTNGDWLWTGPVATPASRGWVQKQNVKPVISPAPM